MNLFEAAITGNIERIQEYLDQDSNATLTYSSDGWSPLHLAAFHGSIELVTLLLNRGVDPQA